MARKGLFAAVAAFAASPQGRKLMQQAKAYATSPDAKRHAQQALSSVRNRRSRGQTPR